MRRLALVAAVLAAVALAVLLVFAIRREGAAAKATAGLATDPEPAVSSATAAPPATERGSIEGTVRDLAGAPLAGVHLRLVSRGDGLAGAQGIEVRTDFEGTFRIDGIEPGRAALVAHQSGLAIGTSRAVRVVPHRTVRADFALPEAGFLAGRVTGTGGRPSPAGIEVIAVPMNAGLGALQVARAAVDATGAYRLPLPAGEYRVHAAPSGALFTDLRNPPAFAAVRAEGTTRTDLTASAAGEETGVSVRVREPGGAPSAGAVVTLSRAGDPRVALATTAGEDGRAIVSARMGIGGRDVTVHAKSGGRTGEWTGPFPESGELVVALRPGAVVEGIITVRESPVRGGTVEVAVQHAPGTWRPLEVAPFRGDRFELADLPPEPVRLTLRSDDGRHATVEVTLAPGEVRQVELRLAGTPAVPAAQAR